ncbi:MAG: hypothetical protein NVS2B3_09590 [Vulcanimicrobiaceae bacterium]
MLRKKVPHPIAGTITIMKPKAKSNEPTARTTAGSSAVKLSVNVSNDVGSRLRRIAFDERLSESSIVEISLDILFAKSTDAQIGKFLRDRGASLRRATRDVAR